jgi:transcriptional regulator with GAF, ATPase, and Fis domain
MAIHIFIQSSPAMPKGPGKELVARAVQNNSSRKQHPLVKINCAALPSNLIEKSELFGH